MSTQVYNLWKNTPGICEEIPKLTYYKPQNKISDIAVIIFAGGGYDHRANHEGYGYAEFLSKNGISSFVVDYRVHPHLFPLPLNDARRSVKFVRYYADKFGVSKEIL